MEENIRLTYQKALIDRFAPPGVLLNHQDQILFAQGNVENFFKKPNLISSEIHGVIIDDIKKAISEAITKTRQTKKETSIEIRQTNNPVFSKLELVVTPLPFPQNDLLMIVFQGSSHLTKPNSQDKNDQRFVDELLDNSALGKNEPPEMATGFSPSKFHVKDSNETVGESKNPRYSVSESVDLDRSINESLLHSEVAMVLLDQDLKIVKSTHAIHKVLGQSIELNGFHKLKQFLAIEDLEQRMQKVILDQTSLEIEVKTESKRYLNLKLLPLKEDGFSGVAIIFYDITGKKKLENELVDTQQHLQELISEKNKKDKTKPDFLELTNEVARIGGWELDLRSNKVFWTKNTYRIHGVPTDQEILLEKALDFYPDKYRSIIASKLELAIQKGEPYDVEVPFRNSRGEKLLVRTIGYPVYEAGKCIRLYGTFQDISEKEQARQKIMEAEERYRGAFNMTPDAILIGKLDGTIVEVNHSFEKISGYSSDEVIGKKTVDLSLWTSDGDRQRMISELRKKGVINNREVKFYKKDGTKLITSFSATFLQFQGQNYILSITRDISEQKEIEKKLRINQDRFEAIFHHSDNAILIADDHGRYSSVNKSAAELLGYDIEDLEQMNVSDISILMENTTSFGYESFVKHGREKGEFTYNHPDGKKRTVMYNAVRIGENINFSIMSDISDRKRNEEKIRENFNFIVNLTNNAPGTLFQCTIDENNENLRWNYLSAASKTIFGLDYDSVKKNPELLFKLIIPEDWPAFEVALNQSFTDLKKIMHEFRVNVNSTIKWIMVRANPIRLKNGSVTCYGYLQDITDSKQSKDEILRSENIFRTITELSPTGITILDENKSISFVNKSVEKISGYQTAELINHKIRGVHPNYRKKVFKELDNLMSGRIETMDTEIQMVHRSGASLWVRVLGTQFPALESQNKEAVLLIIQDISEQKAVETQLTDSKEQLQNIANSIPGLVLRYQLYPDGRDQLLFISEGVEVIFEVMHQEAINNPGLLWNRIHPEDVEEYKKSIEISARDLSFWDVEHRLLLPGGKIKWINGRAWPKRMKDGSVIWDTLLFDITKGKKVQNDLIKSERLSKAIADAIPGLIYIYDLDELKNVWSNFKHVQVFNAQLKYDASQGLNLEDIGSMVHPEDFPMVIEKTNQLQQNPGLADLEMEVRIKFHDQWRWMNLHAAPFLIETNGRLKQILGALFDIDDRKKMESALVESEEKYRFIIEKTSDLIALINRDVKVDILSQNLEKYTGYTPEEFQDFGFAQNVHPDEKNLVNSTLQKLFQNVVEEEVIEYRLKKKSNNYIWLRTRAKSIKDREGQLMFILVSASDITDQKVYEQQLIEAKEKAEVIKEELHLQNERFMNQNEELRKANLELDNFVYRVSHDLRAPITSAIGLTQLNLLCNDIEEIHHHHKLQMKSLQKLDNFIKDILNFTRNSRLEVMPEAVDFNELIQTALAENTSLIEENGVKVSKRIINHPQFKSDNFRLQIILNNLISNAVKYQIRGADNSYININIEASEKNAFIKIEDNGIGIDVSHYDKIFNMFYRATDRAPGSGLGLYIVKDSLERIKGSITFNSNVGHGTTFEVNVKSMES